MVGGRSGRLPIRREQRQTVGVDHHRTIDPAATRAASGPCSDRRPSPLPIDQCTRTDRRRPALRQPIRVLAARCQPPRWASQARRDPPGTRSNARSPLRPGWRRPTASTAAPSRPGLPPITQTACCHLWAVGRRSGSQPRPGRSLPEGEARARSVARPMSATCDLTGQGCTRFEDQARLERGEGDRGCCRQH